MHNSTTPAVQLPTRRIDHVVQRWATCAGDTLCYRLMNLHPGLLLGLFTGRLYSACIRDVVDTKKKDSSKGNVSVCDWNTLQKELDVVQFNGGGQKEVNLGNQSLMGPWIRDEEASSKYSANKFELTGDYVTVKEDGLYLIYAQVVYLTRSPTCYYIIWARQTGKHPRLLSTCATGDDSSNRPLSKSEMSCSLQTVARLYKEDIVNIAQREPNRTVLLRPGYSYFGFVKLKS